MTKVLINQYSKLPQKKGSSGSQELFQRGTVVFPLQYYLNNTVDPYYDLPVHWHKEFELVHVISGTYNTFVGDHEYALEKDDLCFIPSKVLHGDARNKGQALYESVVFDIDLIRQHSYAPDFFINEILSENIVLNYVIPHTHTEICETVKNFFTTLKNNTYGHELISSGYLLIFLGLLKKEHLYSEKVVMSNHKQKQGEQIQAVLNLIRKEYSRDLSLEDMAGTAGLSPKYFCRVFREVTERSPIEYLNWFRVNQACTKLRESHEKLPEIAYSCGFNDLSYFIKIFRRYKGMTPLKYRNLEPSDDEGGI